MSWWSAPVPRRGTDIRELLFFRGAAERQGRARAARDHLGDRIEVAGPDLPLVPGCRRVQGLESALGQRLFERTGRGVRLTRAGGVFLPIAERLLKTVVEGRQALEAAQSSEGGLVTVAAALSVSTSLLPEIVKGFRDEHPAARVSTRSGHSRDVLRLVMDEEAEIGLARGLPSCSAHCAPGTRRDHHVIMVVPPSHPFTAARQVRLADVAGQPLVLFDEGSSDWILITGFFRRGGLLPNVVLELEGIEAAKKMVEKGIGLAMLPQLAVRQELRARSLVHVRIKDARSLARHVDLVYRRKDPQRDRARVSAPCAAGVPGARAPVRDGPAGGGPSRGPSPASSVRQGPGDSRERGSH